MPNPKNNLKPVGAQESLEMDVLLPADDGQPRVYADGWVPPQQRVEEEKPASAAVVKIGRVEAKSPWLAIGAGVALGWLVARMVRR